MEMPAAFVMSVNGMAREAHSAGPHAPVVPYVEHAPRGRRIRLTVADALSRAARAITPVECPTAGHHAT